jgi:uncharacterized membrane protein YphA (DoxX/SURF4 family)
MKYFIMICRIIVGSIFIISGLIKVNDAVGFSYKLLEYFSFKALDFPSLEPYALEFSIFIAVGEVLLGVAALLGAWPKFTSTLLFLLCVFFGWLTYYTATCEPNSLKIFTDEAGKYYIDSPDCVTECGCFGDAIKFTPWQSFTKDMVLLVLIIPFLIGAWVNRQKLNTSKEDIIIGVLSVLFTAGFCAYMLKWYFPVGFVAVALIVGVMIKRMTKEKIWLVALGVLALTSFVQFWTLEHQPFKDFRPYAIGQNIVENMKSAEELGLQAPEKMVIYTLTKPSTGETKEINSNDYLSQKVWEDKSWEIITGKTRTVTVKEGYEPKIMDFSVYDADGNEIREDFFAMDQVFLMITWNIKPDDKGIFDGTDVNHIEEVNAFAKKCEEAGIPFYGITSADWDTIEEFRHENQCAFPFLQGDMKVLQTMIRNNPGIMYFEKATVVNKWSAGDLPDFDTAKAQGFKP